MPMMPKLGDTDSMFSKRARATAASGQVYGALESLNHLPSLGDVPGVADDLTKARELLAKISRQLFKEAGYEDAQ